MSNHRELLKRALELFESDNMYTAEFLLNNVINVTNEIKAELAKPEPEPVAFMTDDKRMLIFADKNQSKTGIPLYTSPPKPKPLSNNEIYDAIRGIIDYDYKIDSFDICLIRAIEKAHGIE